MKINESELLSRPKSDIAETQLQDFEKDMNEIKFKIYKEIQNKILISTIIGLFSAIFSYFLLERFFSKFASFEKILIFSCILLLFLFSYILIIDAWIRPKIYQYKNYLIWFYLLAIGLFLITFCYINANKRNSNLPENYEKILRPTPEKMKSRRIKIIRLF